MSLYNCAITTGDASGSGITFLTFLDEKPDLLNAQPERLEPNRLYGWHNGVTDMVEVFVVSADGYWFNRLASGKPQIAEENS